MGYMYVVLLPDLWYSSFAFRLVTFLQASLLRVVCGVTKVNSSLFFIWAPEGHAVDRRFHRCRLTRCHSLSSIHRDHIKQYLSYILYLPMQGLDIESSDVMHLFSRIFLPPLCLLMTQQLVCLTAIQTLLRSP